MAGQPTTQLQVSGYRFVTRRIEGALLRGEVRPVRESPRSRSQSLAVGCLLAAVAVAGCTLLAFVRPQPALGSAPIILDRQSGALYVQVDQTLHPVLNLASARLIAATDADPQPVRESDLGRARRGALLGIPGAPQVLGAALSDAESSWAVCDTAGDATPTTTVIVGAGRPETRSMDPEQTVLVTSGGEAATYLLYRGRRAVVDLADPVVVHALRLAGLTPRRVSGLLLNAIPEAPPITAPRVPGAGGRGALPGFPVGSVIRVARVDAEDYYVVLAGGIQRVGRVAAELLRLTDSQRTREVVSVAPDVIGTAPTVQELLAVATFPDRVGTPMAGNSTLCVNWARPQGDGAAITLSAGDGLPLPAGQAPTALAQADGEGPALDAVYLPPGRIAYVRCAGASGPAGGARYLVSDTGVRFAVGDDDAARSLGLPATPAPAPWPVLAGLPAGPQLSRQNALVARDVVAVATTGGHRPP